MIKVIFLGMMAACAMAQLPMMGGFGGLDIKNLAGMIPEGALDMIKNMKPEDIKKAVENMPPEMAQMMKGMGISEEQIKEAVNNMPKDFDVAAIVDKAKDNMGQLLDSKKEELKEMMAGNMDKMKEEAKKHLEDMGLDLNGGAEGLVSQMLPRLTQMIGEDLKAQGIDIDDREKMTEEVKKQIRKFAEAKEDDTDEEVREKLMKNFLVEMKNNGFKINTDNTQEGFQELKKQIIQQLNKYGFDIDEDLDIKEVPEMLKKIMQSGKFNPQDLMMMAAPGMQGPPMMGPGPMGTGPMRRGPMGPMVPRINLDININRRSNRIPFVKPSYVKGAEDSLMSAFGDDSDVVRHVMAVKYGAETGTVMEDDLQDLIQDLLHYRLQARVLMAKNQMLRERLEDTMMV